MKTYARHVVEELVKATMEDCCLYHGIGQASPRAKARMERYAPSYDRAAQRGLEEDYARTNMHHVSPESNDLLRDMHKDQLANKATAEDTASIRNTYAQIENAALQIVGHMPSRMSADQCVEVASKLVDTCVGGVLIYGNDADYLDYASHFMRELRRQFAHAGTDPEMMVKLARVEDKLAFGRESAAVMQKKLVYPNGAVDMFDHAMNIIIRHRPEGHPDRESRQLSDEEVRATFDLSGHIYGTQLQGLGLTNEPLPQFSFYSFALLQRAVHVAEAEFLRLPKDHPAREGNQVEARKYYSTERVPEILREILGRFPPVSAEAAAGEDIHPLHVFHHDADALFAAARALRDMQQKAAGRGR